MDLAHIILTFDIQAIVNAYPADVAQCKQEFPTFYVVALIFMALGYLSIVRLLYLIFPHLIGYKFFSYKQSKDTINQAAESKDLNIYVYGTYFREKNSQSFK